MCHTDMVLRPLMSQGDERLDMKTVKSEKRQTKKCIKIWGLNWKFFDLLPSGSEPYHNFVIDIPEITWQVQTVFNGSYLVTIYKYLVNFKSR